MGRAAGRVAGDVEVIVEPLIEVLAVGGRSNSLGRNPEVVQWVLQDPELLDELVGCVKADDPWVRMRAIDAFEKVVAAQPALLEGYVPWIVEDLTTSSQPSIQWHVAQLLARAPLTSEQQRSAVGWLCARLEDPHVDWIVAANTMRTLTAFAADRAVDVDRVRGLLLGMDRHASKTVRRKARELAADLDR